MPDSDFPTYPFYTAGFRQGERLEELRVSARCLVIQHVSDTDDDIYAMHTIFSYPTAFQSRGEVETALRVRRFHDDGSMVVDDPSLTDAQGNLSWWGCLHEETRARVRNLTISVARMLFRARQVSIRLQ